MFGDVNEKVGTIAAEVGQTPQGWNAGIFSMIQSLSENVIVPIAGLVITYVLCVELDPEIVSGLAFAFGIGNQRCYQLQDVLFAMDIGERVIVHGLLEVDGI